MTFSKNGPRHVESIDQAPNSNLDLTDLIPTILDGQIRLHLVNLWWLVPASQFALILYQEICNLLEALPGQ